MRKEAKGLRRDRLIKTLVEYERRARTLRSKIFAQGVVNDMSWPLMQDLFAAHLSGEKMRTTELCESSGLAMTTVLRYLGHLEGSGLVARQSDPHDLRVTLVSLTAPGALRMRQYYTRVIEAEGLLGRRNGGISSITSEAI
jgi:DNA-binding MarR family transcriptional regulator